MNNGSGSNQAGTPVVLREFEFPQTIVGRLRRSIHKIAGQWALRYLVQQQNEINIQQNLTGDSLKASVQAIDQELVHTRKQLAELTTLVIQQQQRLAKLEADRQHQSEK